MVGQRGLATTLSDPLQCADKQRSKIMAEVWGISFSFSCENNSLLIRYFQTSMDASWE